MSGCHLCSDAEYSKRLGSVTSATSGISDEPIYRLITKLLHEKLVKDNALASETNKKLSLRVLDAGAGIGILTHRLINSGLFDITVGIDYLSPDPRLDLNAKWVRCDLNRDFPFFDVTFDVVTCVEVIEHLENPSELLRKLRRIMKKDGLLLLSTPNNASLRDCLSLLLRGWLPDFGPSAWPTHISPLLPVNLVGMLHATGFANLRFWYTNVGAIPKIPGWKMKWQHLDGGYIFRGRLFSDNVVVEAWAK